MRSRNLSHKDVFVTVSNITASLLEKAYDLDKAAQMPEEWAMESFDEKVAILNPESFAIIGRLKNRELIFLGIVIPSFASKSVIGKDDSEFVPSEYIAYSYSQAVTFKHQGQGLGTLLLKRIAKEAKVRGYRQLSAYVRMRHGWHIGRRKILNIVEEHMATHLWDIVSEGEMNPKERDVMFQLAQL